MVADRNTPIPDGSGTFFFSPFSERTSVHGQNIAFVATGAGDQEGVYAEIGGVLDVVADRSTPIPGGSGAFEPQPGSFALADVSLSADAVAFVGRGAGQEGLYWNVNGDLELVVDLSYQIPGQLENFTGFRGPSLDGDEIAFRGAGDPPLQGIYAIFDGTTQVIADTTTQVPGQSFNFQMFEISPSLDSGNVAFLGRRGIPPNVYQGLFALYKGVLQKVVDTTGILDGKTVRSLHTGPEALSGENIVFRVTFIDDSEAIYVARSRVILSDGFESGDLSAWSSAVPSAGG